MPYEGVSGEEEDADDGERVVYYDLDESSRRKRQRKPFQRAPPSSGVLSHDGDDGRITMQPKDIFYTSIPSSLFHLHDLNDSEEEDVNPFGTLLPPTSTEEIVAVSTSPVSPSSPKAVTRITPPQSKTTSKPNHRTPMCEAATARPARWGSTRRQSIETKAKKPVVQRRKSLPSTFPMEKSTISSTHRRLSDVLQKATLQSSQSHPSAREESIHVVEEQEDGIVNENDHSYEMQYFSPTKNPRRRGKPDTTTFGTKIRGAIGDIISKAVRKTNRAVTMLHSHGLTLLKIPTDTENVQNRPFISICLKKMRQHPQLCLFDAHVHEITLNEGKIVPSNVLAVFSKQLVKQQQLQLGMLVKIYSPFHVIDAFPLPGLQKLSGKKRGPYLVGTQLCEVVDGIHHC